MMRVGHRPERALGHRRHAGACWRTRRGPAGRKRSKAGWPWWIGLCVSW